MHHCYEDEDAAQAARLMSVAATDSPTADLSRSKQLVGIVSLGDLATKGEDATASGGVLKQVSS
jgi:hypothetical protein